MAGVVQGRYIDGYFTLDSAETPGQPFPKVHLSEQPVTGLG